jgi:hypothetical protein
MIIFEKRRKGDRRENTGDRKTHAKGFRKIAATHILISSNSHN